MAFGQNIYHICCFLQKRELVLRGLFLEGRYFQGWGGGGHYFRDLLFTPVTFYCSVRRFATFERSLLSELYGKYLGMRTGFAKPSWPTAPAAGWSVCVKDLLQSLAFAFDTVVDSSSCWHVEITHDSNTHDRMYKPDNSLVHSRASSIFTKEVICLERKESNICTCNYCKFAHFILMKITKGTL